MNHTKEVKVKIFFLKSWCTRRLSPMAWQRILLKLYPEFRDLGYELSKLENPDREMSFGNKEFKLFLTTVLEMYKTDFLKDIEEMRGRQMTNVVI